MDRHEYPTLTGIALRLAIFVVVAAALYFFGSI